MIQIRAGVFETNSSSTHSLCIMTSIYTYDDWCRYNDELEQYETSFTTPSGDDMIAFGAYGYR